MRILILFLFLFGASSIAYAGCSGHLTYSHNLVVKEDFALSPNQPENFNYAFNDPTCAGSNEVTYLTPRDIVVGLYNDTVKLKLAIKWNSNKPNLPVVPANFTVTVTEAKAGDAIDISAKDGNSVVIDSVASITTAKNEQTITALLQLGICLIRGGGWNPCITTYRNSISTNAGFYTFNLFLSYNKKETTCAPDNLTIKLDPVPLDKVRNSGEVQDISAQEIIILRCSNTLTSASRSSRKIAVYLKSDLVWEQNNSVLKPESDNGVGFILKDSSGKSIHIHNASASNINLNMLKIYDKNMLVNSVESIPLTAKYYVFDASKVKPAELQSKALIVVAYD